jgi:hypothetical protein
MITFSTCSYLRNLAGRVSGRFHTLQSMVMDLRVNELKFGEGVILAILNHVCCL